MCLNLLNITCTCLEMLLMLWLCVWNLWISVFWNRPESGVIKINFDASLFSNQRRIGVGLLARAHCRKCVTGRRLIIDGMFTPEIAEAMAARLAANLASEFQ
ncbi:hypothetical protein CDL12_01191 [Handroanthus impetiginosus]|uniref:RNase H type-1 domain-containing protein n=1 Tax=Handroanthus impetiginosus TaxID=429701 RepID=A0A2G9I8G6_9LAMI|nr:hypothetical protein CDL12_01191 [Handroanthus impetiginosus]